MANTNIHNSYPYIPSSSSLSQLGLFTVKPKTVLITGGCGFIGHHMVEHIHRNTESNIIIIDKLSYASRGYDRLRSSCLLHSPRVKIFTFDLSNPITDGLMYEIGSIDIILHLAADTHVDNSITDPVPFMTNNVLSTITILEFARKLPQLERIVYFSTDEVYGGAPPGVFYKEFDRHNPTNPYSASKSAAESLCLGYLNTYKIPLIIVNVMNAFGERQHVEKYIPKIIYHIMNDIPITIHADKTLNVPGSRFYIHARNISDAVVFLLDHAENGETYNIAGEREVDNLEIAQMIANIMDKELQYEMIYYMDERPGHDIRYALDNNKLISLGWHCGIQLEESLRRTVRWTLNHPDWLNWDLHQCLSPEPVVSSPRFPQGLLPVLPVPESNRANGDCLVKLDCCTTEDGRVTDRDLEDERFDVIELRCCVTGGGGGGGVECTENDRGC